MYTELIKIIEGGLKGDKEKVLNFSIIMSDNLEKSGDLALANRIRSVIENKKGSLVSLDSFNIKPVDVESRLDMVDVCYVNDSDLDPILNKHTRENILIFIESFTKSDEIIKAGIKLNNSLLLYGPPGCGKSTVAKFLAKLTGLPLVTVRLDGLISSLLGSTAKNIRKIFDYASKRDCILFLDEFDVIAKLRDDKNDLGELKRVVNSLLQNIDEFNDNSILVAATNHHQLLDPAVWRRFSNIILLDKPKEDEREEYIRRLLSGYDNEITHLKSKLDSIITSMENKSYSEIETIIHNAIKKSIITNKLKLYNYDILIEVFLHDQHEISSDEVLIKYLLDFGVTQRELNEELKFSLRKIRELSKD